MKICLISNLYPPIARGGAEKIAQIVAEGLKSAGHEVFVISTKPWGGWKSFKPIVAEENGIKVYRFYPLNLFYYLNDYKHHVLWRMKWHFFDMFNLHGARAVKKILQKEKPELVMTHNLKGIGYLIPRAIKKLGIKHIHTLHDVQLAVPSGLIIKGRETNWSQRTWLRKIYEIVCRRLFNSPDVVVSPSKWLLDFYSEKGFFKNSKKIVLSNPIGLRQSQTINLFPERSVAESKDLQLLYLGQIEEHKGILFLVDALRKIDIDFKLHVAGDGSKIEKLKNIIGEDVRFVIHGKLSGDEVAKIFEQIDLTVVPSLCYENSPTVIYESLAAGVPVLAAKIGGVAEIVHDGQNGFTFEAGDVEDLTRVLKRATTRRDELQKMCQMAVKLVEYFGVENYIKKLF